MSSQEKVPPGGFHRQRSEFGSYGPGHFLREGTKLRHSTIKFLLNAGGMGDYVNYSAALLWAAQNLPWIHGQVYVSSFFCEFLEVILRDYPQWSVHDGASIRIESDDCFIGPEIIMGDQNITRQLANATGAHLMDLGFQYYVNMQAAPPEVMLPRLPATLPYIDGAGAGLRPGKYVVFTPGAVVPSRATTGKHLNPLIDFCREHGLTPVFLGKDGFAQGMKVGFADDINYSKGIDLRGKTTTLQAAAIMEHSFCVLGLDNGLLHLAATTNASLLFGYNITTVEQRIPRRDWGRTFNLALSPQELACVGCQTHGKLILNHTYHQCLYGDTLCIDKLFASGRYEGAILELLKEKKDAV